MSIAESVSTLRAHTLQYLDARAAARAPLSDIVGRNADALTILGDGGSELSQRSLSALSRGDAGSHALGRLARSDAGGHGGAARTNGAESASGTLSLIAIGVVAGLAILLAVYLFQRATGPGAATMTEETTTGAAATEAAEQRVKPAPDASTHET